MTKVEPEYYTFSGDSQFDYLAVWRGKYGWLATPTHTTNFAHWTGVGILSPQTMERMFRLWSLVGLIDDMVDCAFLDDPGEIMFAYDTLMTNPHVDNVPTWASTDIVPIIHLLRIAMDDLGPQAWENLKKIGTDIVMMSFIKANESSIFNYAFYVEEEAKLTSQLVFACMTKEERNRPGFRRFARAFTHLSTAGVLFDHARDLVDDYDQGNTDVIPTKVKQGMLYCLSFLEIIHTVSTPRVLAKLVGLPWNKPLSVLRNAESKMAIKQELKLK